jgi:DNA-binding transcriptional LysR family regulator
VPSTVYYFLSHVIRRYHERYPKIRVKVLDAGANEVLAQVASGEVDFGLNFIGGAESDIEMKPLLEDRFVAACRRDHPLARKRSATWSDLAQYDYISVSKSSGNRLLLDQALAHVAGRPQAIYEAQHVTTMIGLVEAGLGVAAVPSLAMPAADHPLLVSVPLTDPVVTRRVGLIRRKGRTLSPSAQQLYDFLLEMKPARRKAVPSRPAQ